MRTIAVAAVTTLVLVLGACGEGGDRDAGASADPAPSPSTPASGTAEPADDTVVVEVTLADDGPTPRGDRVEVEIGQPVRLVVSNRSSEADEVHVHSDPEHSLDVAAGASGELEFTVDRPGQVAVESHHADAVIVQLVVS
ncbi:MAG: hypothetical protein P1U38_05480 [Aeromicrobium sp.]|uniref:hypothetical protein n=1 Tax=Aeromicrobium sp. TaxID=1871063 RepID=UPI00262BEBBD|nr:hypothetical protein [Aeromicrobium sp.]MDF1704207.1 hypothetical protein [Aeromicrobium sp.]